jgi:DNA-binding MarR family transcriptional regulator
MEPEQVATVRRLNRLVTQRSGALEEHFLGRERPLGESRVLYEIGPEGAILRDVRVRLGLDSGYLSRIVHALAARGLVRVDPHADDERVRIVRLTRAGRDELREMDRRADETAAAILDPLTDAQRAQLAAAMADVHRLLRYAGVRIERVDPASDDARRCVARYFEELDRRFDGGFDPGASLTADDADLVPPRGAFLVARCDGLALASGAVKPIAPGVGCIKRMWVDESLRGLGLGRRMLGALEDQARALGFAVVRLETNRALREAIRLYERTGYRAVPAFSDDPYADHWFEKRLD